MCGTSRFGLLGQFPGARLVVRVQVEQIFPNCPRYIHRMQVISHSPYVPRGEESPPEPEWKEMAEFRDALPRREAHQETG